MKLHSSDDYEPIRIKLDPLKFPKVFNAKVDELMTMGLPREKAVKHARNLEIEMEVYYEKGYGLMAVEAGAVEAGTIYSPYTSEQYEDYNS